MAKWQDLGYKIMLWRDSDADSDAFRGVAMLFGIYPGYARATNELIQFVMCHDPRADWFVTGGDDVDPDPTKTADEIAFECDEHFRDHWNRVSRDQTLCIHPLTVIAKYQTFGVMQPTGDRWGDRQGAYIDRVAGSPWIGREFARRAYRGNGPYWPEYTHMGVDEELQAVAAKLGVFWQRPDLTHYHDHWGRAVPPATIGHRSNMPAFLEAPNTQAEWDRYKSIFAARAAAGFPGSEVIP